MYLHYSNIHSTQISSVEYKKLFVGFAFVTDHSGEVDEALPSLFVKKVDKTSHKVHQVDYLQYVR